LGGYVRGVMGYVRFIDINSVAMRGDSSIITYFHQASWRTDDEHFDPFTLVEDPFMSHGEALYVETLNKIGIPAVDVVVMLPVPVTDMPAPAPPPVPIPPEMPSPPLLPIPSGFDWPPPPIPGLSPGGTKSPTPVPVPVYRARPAPGYNGDYFEDKPLPGFVPTRPYPGSEGNLLPYFSRFVDERPPPPPERPERPRRPRDPR